MTLKGRALFYISVKTHNSLLLTQKKRKKFFKPFCIKCLTLTLQMLILATKDTKNPNSHLFNL